MTGRAQLIHASSHVAIVCRQHTRVDIPRPSSHLPSPFPACRHPWADASVFIAPNASVIGRVDINQYSSVWYGAVVRGDLNDVTIGAYSSIGDRAVVHTTKSVEGHVSAGTTIGNYVTVGPGALLQSCTVEDYAVIGAGASSLTIPQQLLHSL